jgi:hypothetical protein
MKFCTNDTPLSLKDTISTPFKSFFYAYVSTLTQLEIPCLKIIPQINWTPFIRQHFSNYKQSDFSCNKLIKLFKYINLSLVLDKQIQHPVQVHNISMFYN